MRSRPSPAICRFARPGSVSPSSFSFIIASQHFRLNAFATPLVARIQGLRSKNTLEWHYCHTPSDIRAACLYLLASVRCHRVKSTLH